MTKFEQKLYEIIKELYEENKELQKKICELEQSQAERNSIQMIANSLEIQKHIEKMREIFGEDKKYLWDEWLKGDSK